MISSSNCVWMKLVPGIAGIVSLSAVLSVPSWAGESRQMVQAVESSLISQSESVDVIEPEAIESEAVEIESVDIAPSETDSVEVESVEVELPEADGMEAESPESMEAESVDTLEIEASETDMLEPEAADPVESEVLEPEAAEPEILEPEATEPSVTNEATDVSDNELQQFASAIPQLVTIEQTGQEQIFQVIEQSGLDQERFYQIYQSQGQPTADATAEMTATPEEQSSFEMALAQIEEIEQDVVSQQQNVIAASGIDPERFNEIMDLVLSDPQLQLEVQDLLVQ